MSCATNQPPHYTEELWCHLFPTTFTFHWGLCPSGAAVESQPHLTKLGTSNTGGSCEFWDSQIQPNTAVRILAPCPKCLSGAHQNWSRSSPNEGRGKNTQPNTRHVFLNIFGIPGYIALKRPPTTDSPTHLQLKEYISGTGRGAGCLEKAHRQFVE